MLRAGVVEAAKAGLCAAYAAAVVCAIAAEPAVRTAVAIARIPLSETQDIYAEVDRKGEMHAIAPSAADSSEAEREEETTEVIEETEVIGTAHGDKASQPSSRFIVAIFLYSPAEETIWLDRYEEVVWKGVNCGLYG